MSQAEEDMIEFGPFRLDWAGRLLTKGGTRVPLPGRAFDILLALNKHAPEIVSKETLFEEVWSATFVEEHRVKIHLTNPIERLNGEIKRRTEIIGIFPNEAAIARLIGAILLEQNDEWAVQRARYMTLETIAPLGDDLTIMLPVAAA
jgi:hypothetical protein